MFGEGQHRVEGYPEDFGVLAGGELLTPQGDAWVKSVLVGIGGEEGDMGLGGGDFEASLLGPEGNVGRMTREAVRGLRH